MRWSDALERVLETIYAPRIGEPLQWAVVGSAAAALRECQVSPRDVDLLAREPTDIQRFAGLMRRFAPALCEHPPGHAHWLSSAALPVTSGPDEYGFTWHFGRWNVTGFVVEMAHITAPDGFPMSNDGAGIWEAGPEIWPFVRTLPFRGYEVPVVPLEIQLQTCLQRGLTERADEILRVLRLSGCDRGLLQLALSRQNAAFIEYL